MTFASFRIVAVATVLLAWLVPAFGDPIGAEVPKFNQQPMLATPIVDQNGVLTTYYGHDEPSTATVTYIPGTTIPSGYSGSFVADDFADLVSTPVYHLSWWGSYLNSTVVPTTHAQKFLIAFETDVPSNAAVPYSQPGQIISSEVVTLGAISPQSGTFSETQVTNITAPTSADGPTYKYNAELKVPFAEQANTVYWLKIVALDDGTAGPIQWGWHTRDYTLQDPLASVPAAVTPGENLQGFLPDGTTPIWHFQDDAVDGAIVINSAGIRQTTTGPLDYLDNIDGPGQAPAPGFPGISHYSEDMAFELYTVPTPTPEPASLSLLAAGVAALTLRRRRR